MTKNILISDANHGGLTLLEEYSKHTSNNLFFYDTYNKLSKEEKDNISEKFNVTFLSRENILSDEDKYIKINPIHMPPHFSTDYTHHEFTAYLLNKIKKQHDTHFKLIQITGVKGKTTVCSIATELLSDYNTLSLTSNSLKYNNQTLLKNLSITPASVIVALNKAIQENIIEKVDFCIFEVSLGIIPNGEIGVLTNILENYPIASSTSSASIAKESVFKSENVICDYDAFNNYYDKEHDIITLSPDNKNAMIYASNIKYDIENTTFTVNFQNNKFIVNHFALTDFYINNMLFAISIALISGLDTETIKDKLKNTSSIKGRGSYKYINNKLIIEDINPGLNTTSIKKCVNNLKKFNTKYTLIIGGDYGITCEEINEDKLLEYINTIKNEDIVFAGELGINLNKKFNKKFKEFSNINEAIEYCIKNENHILQIIYRSEYHRSLDEIIN